MLRYHKFRILKTVTMLIGLIYEFLHMFIVATEISYFVNADEISEGVDILLSLYGVAQILTGAFLLYGTAKEKPIHLLPWLLLNSLVLIALILATIRVLPKIWLLWHITEFLIPSLACTIFVAFFYKELDAKLLEEETERCSNISANTGSKATSSDNPPPYEEAIKYPVVTVSQ